MEPRETLSRLRTRLPALLGIWGATAVAEGVLYYFFLSRPYFRELFLPLALAVLFAAALATWRTLRGRRRADRRAHDRRIDQRRAQE